MRIEEDNAKAYFILPPPPSAMLPATFDYGGGLDSLSRSAGIIRAHFPVDKVLMPGLRWPDTSFRSHPAQLPELPITL